MAAFIMTSEELVRNDDICTQIFFKFMRFPCRIREASQHLDHPVPRWIPMNITDMIQDYVNGVTNEHSTAVALSQLEPVRRYIRNAHTTVEAVLLHNHLKSYLRGFATNCRWEYSVTRFYHTSRAEVSVSAIRKIQRGSKIEALSATLATLTGEEAETMEYDPTASIAYNQYHGEDQRCLGPARFINHECHPNAELVQTSSASITAYALRDILIGEEITVKYGEHFFGKSNRKCRCHGCFEKHRNGWANKPEDEKLLVQYNQVPKTWYYVPKASNVIWYTCTNLNCCDDFLVDLNKVKARTLTCERCSRHEVIYDHPWPVRARAPHADSQSPVKHSVISFASPKTSHFTSESGSVYRVGHSIVGESIEQEDNDDDFDNDDEEEEEEEEEEVEEEEEEEEEDDDDEFKEEDESDRSYSYSEETLDSNSSSQVSHFEGETDIESETTRLNLWK